MSENVVFEDGQSIRSFVENKDKSLDFYERKMKALEIRNKAQDIAMRKRYADHIFSLVSIYMFAVFLILILSGSPSSFSMSDTVLVTLLGTTTANVIGVLVIVAKYLFPKK